jgi:uncharacterized OB-fold protein
MVHKAWFPAFKDETPYNVVQVELDEGPRLTSRIVGCGDQKIQIGQRVEVVFDDIDEELTFARVMPKTKRCIIGGAARHTTQHHWIRKYSCG